MPGARRYGAVPGEHDPAGLLPVEHYRTFRVPEKVEHFETRFGEDLAPLRVCEFDARPAGLSR